jgi:hypothetical protein
MCTAVNSNGHHEAAITDPSGSPFAITLIYHTNQRIALESVQWQNTQIDHNKVSERITLSDHATPQDS